MAKELERELETERGLTSDFTGGESWDLRGNYRWSGNGDDLQIWSELGEAFVDGCGHSQDAVPTEPC